MKHASTLAANVLALAGLLLGTSAQAAGLPVAAYRTLKLPAYTTHAGAVNYTIRLTGGQIDGTVTAVEGMTFSVTTDDETDYTVDTTAAAFVNAVGRKAKRADVLLGDRVVVDGYFANNSTGMTARRVINVDPAPRT